MRHCNDSLLEWARAALDDDSARVIDTIADASTRTFVRLGSAGATYIVMDAPGQSALIRQFVDVAGRLNQAGVTVPTLYAVEEEQGLVLMSDFGESTYLNALATEPAEALYRDAIDALVRMQLNADHCGLPDYDREFLLREMRLFPEFFLEQFLQIPVTAAVERRLETAFELLCRSALAQPRVFVHRDYHSRNLLRIAAGNPGIVDFQDAVCGPCCYDLVSLLRDVYVEWPEATVDEWAGYYRARAGALCGDLSEVEFRRAVDFMGLQRHLKIAGLFVRLQLRDGKPGYLRDLPLTLRYVAAALARHAELADLGQLLEELDVFGRAQARFDAAASSPEP